MLPHELAYRYRHKYFSSDLHRVNLFLLRTYTGDGESFQGVYDRTTKQVHLFTRGDRRRKISANIVDLEDPQLEEVIGNSLFMKLLEDIEMLDGLIPAPDIAKIQNGEQSPGKRLKYLNIITLEF